VSSILAGAPVEPRLDKLLAVTREAAANAGRVRSSTWEDAAVVWSERELIGSLTFVVLTGFTDWFVRLGRPRDRHPSGDRARTGRSGDSLTIPVSAPRQ
jgi:hypothetical protein